MLVLNRGEAVNALKRAIYTGLVAGYQAKRPVAVVGDRTLDRQVLGHSGHWQCPGRGH
jgi:hypothetical protein